MHNRKTHGLGKIVVALIVGLIVSLSTAAKADIVDDIKAKINGPVTKQSCRSYCDHPPTSWDEQSNRTRKSRQFEAADVLRGKCYASCEKFPNDAATTAKLNSQNKAATDSCKANIADWKKQAADLNHEYGFLSGNKAKDQRVALKAKIDPLSIKISDCKKLGIE